MIERDPLPDDQEKATMAYQLIEELVESNPQLDYNVWMGGLWTAISNCYHANDITYEQFCREIDDVKEFYKHMWENP